MELLVGPSDTRSLRLAVVFSSIFAGLSIAELGFRIARLAYHLENPSVGAEEVGGEAEGGEN